MSRWLYSVYRNDNDRLVVLDAPPQDAIRAMKVKPNTFYRILALSGGKNEKWTIIRTEKNEVARQMEEQ